MIPSGVDAANRAPVLVTRPHDRSTFTARLLYVGPGKGPRRLRDTRCKVQLPSGAVLVVLSENVQVMPSIPSTEGAGCG